MASIPVTGRGNATQTTHLGDRVLNRLRALGINLQAPFDWLHHEQSVALSQTDEARAARQEWRTSEIHDRITGAYREVREGALTGVRD